MSRLTFLLFLVLAMPGSPARAEDAATRDLIARLEADDRTYRDERVRHPVPESAELTATRRTLGALARDRAFLASACAAMAEVPEYVDIWEATKLGDDTFNVFALAYNEAVIAYMQARAGVPATADRARCLAARRNYRLSIDAFAAQLARLKREGY